MVSSSAYARTKARTNAFIHETKSKTPNAWKSSFDEKGKRIEEWYVD